MRGWYLLPSHTSHLLEELVTKSYGRDTIAKNKRKKEVRPKPKESQEIEISKSLGEEGPPPDESETEGEKVLHSNAGMKKSDISGNRQTNRKSHL